MKCILFLICCSAFILSCNKKAVIGDKFMTLSYKQTHCSDLWITNPTNDNITVNNISHFLDSAGMTSPEFGVNIRNDGVAEICSACTCKTGKNIYVTVLYSAVLLSKYQLFGFTRIQ